HADAAADVAGDGGEEPVRERRPWRAAGERRSEDLTCAGDAVCEVAQADHKREHPDDHDGTGDGVRAGDEPRDGGDDPAAHDAGPEDGGGRMMAGFEAELDQPLHHRAGSAVVRTARVAKASAPQTLKQSTMAQRRMV